MKKALFTSEEQEKYRLKAGDLLICEGGEIGKSCVWTKQSEMYYQNALHRVRFFDGISPYFFKMLMEYYKKSNLLDKYGKGVTIKHLVQASLNSVFFPLPPINEQTQIINKLNEIDKHIEKYDVIEKQLFNLNSTYKEQLKKSILQYTIEGKLVEQDSSDESVEILLSKIKEEKEKLIKEGKIKRNKKESIIFKGSDNSYYENINGKVSCIDDVIPFEIPDSWDWTRLKTVCNMYTGNSINSADKNRYFTNVLGKDYIGTKDVNFDGTINYSNGICIPENYTKFRIAPNNSILMCIEGGSAGRKIAKLSKDVCFGNKLCCFVPYIIDSDYLLAYLKSPSFFSSFIDCTSGIIGGVSMNNLKELLIPIPPFEEQIRISKVLKKCFLLL